MYSPIYIFILTILFSPLLLAKNNSMMPRQNPFKKPHKPTIRLKFADQRPEIAEKSEGEEKILEGNFRGTLKAHEFDNLSLVELRERKIDHVNSSDKEIAVKYIEKMMILCQEQKELKELRLELANLHFDLEDYEKSGKAYAEYISFYPNDVLTEFAAFREVLALDLQKNDPDRDQLMTKDAILKGKLFIKNEQYKTYRKGVLDILQDCYKSILDNEICIFRFYVNIKKNPRSAECRLEYIKKEVAPYIENSEKIVKDLDGQLQALKDGKLHEFNKSLRKQNENEKKLDRQKNKSIEVQKPNGKTKPHRDRF